MSENEKLIEIGYCKKPHGIKGEFSLFLFNTDDSSLKYIKSLMLFPFDKNSSLDNDGEEFEIDQVRIGTKNILKLKNVDNRNLAEELLPFKVFVSRSDLKATEEDEVYLNDLIGFKVVDEDYNDQGLVDSFYDNGVQDVMVVKGAKTLDVLMIDQFILNIDEETKVITIKTMEII